MRQRSSLDQPTVTISGTALRRIESENSLFHAAPENRAEGTGLGAPRYFSNSWRNVGITFAL